MVGSFVSLIVCRAFLGFAEAGGVPATGKGFAMYLPPEDRATGAALKPGWPDDRQHGRSAVHRMDVGAVWLAVGIPRLRRIGIRVDTVVAEGSTQGTRPTESTDDRQAAEFVRCSGIGAISRS